MVVEEMERRLREAVANPSVRVPAKVYRLKVVDLGRTYVLNGGARLFFEDPEIVACDCEIEASFEDLVKVMKTPSLAPGLLVKRKVKISNMAALTPLLPVLAKAMQ